MFARNAFCFVSFQEKPKCVRLQRDKFVSQCKKKKLTYFYDDFVWIHTCRFSQKIYFYYLNYEINLGTL